MSFEPSTLTRHSRRHMLRVLTAGGVACLAGCLGGSDEVPDPISLDGNDQLCDSCNMVVENHPGPVGQAFYLDDAPTALPEDRDDGIAWFCSTLCTYRFVLEEVEYGHEPVVVYSTDYSSVDYRLSDDGGATVISAHVEADAFEDVSALTFVVDSDVQGAMGSSLIGFTDANDAESFVAEHGGDRFTDEDITDELIAALAT